MILAAFIFATCFFGGLSVLLVLGCCMVSGEAEEAAEGMFEGGAIYGPSVEIKPLPWERDMVAESAMNPRRMKKGRNE